MKKNKKITNAVLDIVWMARRYADGRMTYAPSMFNKAYDVLQEELGFKEVRARNGIEDEMTSFPYANSFPYAKYGGEI